MTDLQREKIAYMREQDYGYAAIAVMLGISKNTVKSYCQRNHLAGKKQKTISSASLEGDCCKQCGRPLQQVSGRKPVKFCSEECRVKWWNSHPEQVNRKAVYTFTCACCGKSFTAYGNAKRKYCSHDCYIADRFKGGCAS